MEQFKLLLPVLVAAGMNSWNLSVTGSSTNITNGETVVFSGQDAITTTRDGNTVIISGAAGGGGTASGVAFFGDDNNLTSETSILIVVMGIFYLYDY